MFGPPLVQLSEKEFESIVETLGAYHRLQVLPQLRLSTSECRALFPQGSANACWWCLSYSAVQLTGPYRLVSSERNFLAEGGLFWIFGAGAVEFLKEENELLGRACRARGMPDSSTGSSSHGQMPDVGMSDVSMYVEEKGADRQEDMLRRGHGEISQTNEIQMGRTERIEVGAVNAKRIVGLPIDDLRAILKCARQNRVRTAFDVYASCHHLLVMSFGRKNGPC